MVLGALLSDHRSMSTPPDEDNDPVDPVDPVRRRRSDVTDPRPSLAPPLLSGRSLQAPKRQGRFAWFREHPRTVVAVLLAVLALVGILGGRLLAVSAADAAMDRRAAEMSDLLADATPEDFLAFDAGVQVDGSLAQRVRDTDGFVNLRARAELVFIKFQPSGWWAGFTERCLVAAVRSDGTTVEVPETACIRVTAPPD